MRNHCESKPAKPPRDSADVNQWDKIPFQIGWYLFMRSVSNPVYQTRTKIVGVLGTKLLIVEPPEFKLTDRVSEELDGDFLCALMNDGVEFRFYSKFQQVFSDEMVFLQYPCEFKWKKLRAQERVKINLKAELLTSESDESHACDLIDMSEGGCRLSAARFDIKKGAEALVTFRLPPDNNLVRLRCVIARIYISPDPGFVEVGLRFVGPAIDLSKVNEFCRFFACLREQ